MGATLETAIDNAPSSRLRRNSGRVPIPRGLARQANLERVASGEHRMGTGEIGTHLQARFANLFKDYDKTFANKQRICTQARQEAQQFAQNLPEDSPLRFSLQTRSAEELHEAVAFSLGLSNNKYMGGFDQLPAKQQQLVKAIVAGLKTALPDPAGPVSPQIGNQASLDQQQDLMSEIRQRGGKSLSLDALQMLAEGDESRVRAVGDQVREEQRAQNLAVKERDAALKQHQNLMSDIRQQGGKGISHESAERLKQQAANRVAQAFEQIVPEQQALASEQQELARERTQLINARKGLMQEIAQQQPRALTAEQTQTLEQMSAKPITHTRAEIKGSGEALVSELEYPVKDSQHQLDTGFFGPQELASKLKVLSVLHQQSGDWGKAIDVMTARDPKQAEKLIWSLACSPLAELSQAVGVNRAQDLLKVANQKLEGLHGCASNNDWDQPDHSFTQNGKTYVKGERLGSGTFGTAYLYTNPDDPSDKLVVKRFNFHHQMYNELYPSDEGYTDQDRRVIWLKDMQTEIRNQRLAEGKGGHPNLLQMEGMLFRSIPDGPGELALITEPAEAGTLQHAVNAVQASPLSAESKEVLKRYLLGQAIQGMHYFQEDREMLHYDLKPENIFVTSNGTVKVADLGGAVQGRAHGLGLHTREYTSPDALQDPDSATYKNDIWSMGKVAQNASRRIAQRGTQGRSPDAFEQVVNAMMHPDPNQRPTLNAVANHHAIADPLLADPLCQDLMQAAIARQKAINNNDADARRQADARLEQLDLQMAQKLKAR